MPTGTAKMEIPVNESVETEEIAMKKFWACFVNETEGQDVIEYALLAATIGLGTFLGMQAIRDSVNTEFGSIATAIGSGS